MEDAKGPAGAGDGDRAGTTGTAAPEPADDGDATAARPVEAPPGLTDAEPADRLARFGPNALGTERRHLLRTLASKLTGPVPYLLEAAVILELAAGKATEAVIVGALVVFNGVLSFLQEGRAANALALLRNRLAVHARVRRDTLWQVGDPVRSDSAAPVAQLGDLGVRVVMATGDAAPTAVAGAWTWPRPRRWSW